MTSVKQNAAAKKRTSAAKAAPAAGQKKVLSAAQLAAAAQKAKPDSAGNKVNTVQKPAAPKATTKATTKAAKVSNAVATKLAPKAKKTNTTVTKAADANVKNSSVVSKTGAKKKAGDKPEHVTKADKVKKPKLVRDSFTMPEAEYAVLGEVKKLCLSQGVEVKKSQLLRIGLVLLKSLDLRQLESQLNALPELKAGRPKLAK